MGFSMANKLTLEPIIEDVYKELTGNSACAYVVCATDILSSCLLFNKEGEIIRDVSFKWDSEDLEELGARIALDLVW
jgi:hypothetical protein